MDIHNLISFGGLFVLLGFAYILSDSKKNINYKVIIWGLVFQLIFGCFIFVVPEGAKLFLFLNDIVVQIMNSSAEGAKFLFGRLALPPGTTGDDGQTSLGFYLAFQALPTIIFFSAPRPITHQGVFTSVHKTHEDIRRRIAQCGKQYFRRRRIGIHNSPIPESDDKIGTLHRTHSRHGNRIDTVAEIGHLLVFKK